MSLIVIISSAEDDHAQAVMRELANQGARDVRLLNLAEFPMRMDLSLRLDSGGARDFSVTGADGRRIPMDHVTAFWWRRPQPFGLPPTLTNPVHRQFVVSESGTAFQGMWQATQALWVNDLVRDAAAAHKPSQLALASAIGLSIPETLITNNPNEAREFWRLHPGEVVYKMFTATYQAWRETRLVKPEEQALADNIRLAPVIFQRYIPASLDLRITAIGNQLFAAGAPSEHSGYHVDVRFASNISYEPHQLPPEVEQRLLMLMRRLGLEYGAIDMRLTPVGEYVFLEVNPAGQFLYIEHATGMRLAAALASHLIRGERTTETPGATARADGRVSASALTT